MALDFTDEQLTPVAGLAFVARSAHRLGLLKLLDGFEPLKRRDRGASDQENLMALLGCLTSGRGKLCDLDELREDAVARQALGLVQASGSRRMGECHATRKWTGQRQENGPGPRGYIKVIRTAKKPRGRSPRGFFAAVGMALDHVGDVEAGAGLRLLTIPARRFVRNR